MKLVRTVGTVGLGNVVADLELFQTHRAIMSIVAVCRFTSSILVIYVRGEEINNVVDAFPHGEPIERIRIWWRMRSAA
jgi:hypothetical protein